MNKSPLIFLHYHIFNCLIKKNIYHFIAPLKKNNNIVYNLCQEKN